jgi:hypothetical protein
MGLGDGCFKIEGPRPPQVTLAAGYDLMKSE